MANGAMDAAAFNEMDESAQHMHLYQRLVSIEFTMKSVGLSAQNAARSADNVKSGIAAEIEKHATSCLTARKEEADAVEKVENKGDRSLQFAYGIIVLLTGLVTFAFGYILRGGI
jgi:hypothetical protein